MRRVKIRAVFAKGLRRWLYWLISGAVSGATAGGLTVAAFADPTDPGMGRAWFFLVAGIGMAMGVLGGFIMGWREFSEPRADRRKLASDTGFVLGLFLFILGCIPGLIAGYMAAFFMDMVDPISLEDAIRQAFRGEVSG